MNIKDIRLPVKLVSDVDDLHLTPDATTRKVNLNAFAPEGTLGVNVNLLGTKEVEELFSGGASLMGFCEDVERNAIILFVSDANSKGKIVRYYNDPNVTALETIFENDYFTLPNWVNADIVGDMLYWTDGYFGSFTEYDYNPPRKLNITKALNIGDNTVKAKNKYSYLGENFLCFSAAKPTHTNPPTVSYETDETVKRNYLRGRLFQFRVQYVYDDREKSAWSPISKMPLPYGESTTNGTFVLEDNFNNYISIIYNTGNETVTSVNIAYREGNFRKWQLFKTIEKYDTDGDLASGMANNADRSCNFYGNEVAYALDDNEVERLYHDVPIVSKSQKFINGKSLVYANYMAGYENVNAELSLVVDDTQVSLNDYDTIPIGTLYTNYSIDLSNYLNFIKFDITIETELELGGGGSLHQFHVYYYYQTESLDDLIDKIVQEINDLVGYDIASNDDSLLVILDQYSEGGGVVYNVLEPVMVAVYNRENQVKTFKSGSTVDVGIVYYDRIGRCGGVNGVTSVYVPFISETYPSTDFIEPTLFQNKISVTIDSDPPQWATHYQLVVSPKRQTFFQYMVDELVQDGDYVRINLNSAINEGIVYNTKVNYGFYNFRKGDRVRFLYVYAPGVYVSSYNYRVLDEYIDMEIIDVGYDTGDETYKTDDADTPQFILDSDGNKVRKEVSQYLRVADFDFETHGLGNDTECVIEIYTPEKITDDNSVFYEIGECYSITAPHTANAAHSDESITIDGDVYIRGRTRGGDLTFLCEDAHFTDIYESNYWDRGRANVYNELAKTTWYSEYLKHSKNYLKNSVNGLSDFDSSQINLNGKYGEITALNESGYVLQVKQVRKDNSIYIGRVVLNQPDGTNQLSTTDALLGTIMPSQFNYGTVHPKSVVQNGSFTYYFDVYSGKVIRDAYNGPVSISEYGMGTYFKNISESILANPTTSDVIAGFDGKNDSFVLTFLINGTNETVIFNEKNNVWSHYADFTPIGYAYMGNTLLAVNDGKLWLHNDTTVPRNNFYGTQYKSEIRLVFNIEPLKNKIYHNLEFKSSGTWFTEEADIKILNDDGTERMVSYLPDSKFVVKEGSTFATFLRNMANVGNYQKLINGEVLKGRYLVVTLRSADTDKAWLSHTVVNSIISERS